LKGCEGLRLSAKKELEERGKSSNFQTHRKMDIIYNKINWLEFEKSLKMLSNYSNLLK